MVGVRLLARAMPVATAVATALGLGRGGTSANAGGLEDDRCSSNYILTGGNTAPTSLGRRGTPSPATSLGRRGATARGFNLLKLLTEHSNDLFVREIVLELL